SLVLWARIFIITTCCGLTQVLSSLFKANAMVDCGWQQTSMNIWNLPFHICFTDVMIVLK
ncbi:MAG: hypothetical protein KAV87_29585, partial [Desulfobacteraceae bacterium]|nr:hypothetical protein [Desulfobacteraceae bacterium]